MPNSYDNEIQKRRLQAAGLSPEQQAGVTAGTGYSSINSSVLTPAPTINYNSPQYSPVYPVAGLGQDLFTPTEPEKKADDITTQLQQLNERLVGESSYRAEQETAQGVPQLRKDQTDLTARLRSLQNEALAIPLQLQQEAQ